MMKRFICLVLALMTLLTLVACGNVTGGEQGTTDSKEENTVFTGKLDAESYDGVFKAGYSRKDITPVVPINQNDGTVYSKVFDKLYATCVAVNDGETTALMFTIDTKGLGTGPYESIIRRVSMAVSIPEENIMITASHSHTAPMPASAFKTVVKTGGLTKWCAFS